MKHQDLQQKLAQLHPDCGWRVIDVVVGTERSLHVSYFEDGVQAKSPDLMGDFDGMFMKHADPTPYWSGLMDAAFHLAQAMCRFINIGGDSNNVAHVWQRLQCLRFSLVDGFDLLSSIQNEDGDFEHLFGRTDSTQLVRWVEGSFIEAVDELDVANEQKEREAGLGQLQRPGGPAVAAPDPESD